MNPISSLSPHSERLERWLGPEMVAHLQDGVRDWYGPPIAVSNVPGAVYAMKGGDFAGRIKAGQFASLADYYEQRLRRVARNAMRRQLSTCNTGFSSFSDIISEATVGNKKREFTFVKNGTTGVTGGANSLWGVGVSPTAGTNASAAPGGDAVTSATTGAHPFTNPSGGDTQHFVGMRGISSVASQVLLLYDRLFQVNKTMNSNATEAVTGVPTRYQSTTPGDADYVGGNFMFPEVGGTVLASGAHNWNVVKYTNQAGTTGQSAPSTAGVSAGPVRRVDLVVPLWFMPLATGDIGVKAISQMQYDTSAIATGVINWVVGHPIAFLPIVTANNLEAMDGIMTAFNLTRIFDSAALTFLEIMKSTTTATNYTVNVSTVAG